MNSNLKSGDSMWTSTRPITVKDVVTSHKIVTKDVLEELLKKLSKAPLYQHKCINCGGTVELDYDKAIFICPYCGSHYALNTSRINER